MDESELRQKVVDNLIAIAPEADPLTLRPNQSLRSQVDLDSFDWLRFLLALHEQLGVDIPESDYAQLTTLDHIVAYVREKLPH